MNSVKTDLHHSTQDSAIFYAFCYKLKTLPLSTTFTFYSVIYIHIWYTLGFSYSLCFLSLFFQLKWAAGPLYRHLKVPFFYLLILFRWKINIQNGALQGLGFFKALNPSAVCSDVWLIPLVTTFSFFFFGNALSVITVDKIGPTADTCKKYFQIVIWSDSRPCSQLKTGQN